MQRDEIIEMARQAGFFVWTDDQKTIEGYGEDLERFAKLVAAKEREACAVTAEEHFCGCGRGNCPEEDARSYEIAAAIRARGEA